MAKADWIKVLPSSGSGNAEVNVSSYSEHTGRIARQTVLIWKGVNVQNIERIAIQAGKPEYIDIEDSMAADKQGQIVSIMGESNSSKITFSLGVGDLDVTLPNSYLANSIETLNGEEIIGDPGAVAMFPFEIQISVPANDGIEPKSRQIIATSSNGKTDVCLLTLASGDAYLRVQEGDIKLDYLGTPVTVNVESNTTWTIE